MIRIKIKGAAMIQKLIGFSIVFVAAGSEKDILCKIVWAMAGLFLMEVSDAWYKIISRRKV